MASGREPEKTDAERDRQTNRIEYLLESYLTAQLATRSDPNQSRRRPRRIRCKLATVLLLIIIFLGGSLFFFESSLRTEVLGGSNCSAGEIRDANPTAEKSVALIDQLSRDYPNPSFVQQLNQSATKAGYRFDYYPPNSASIDFFMHLPSRNYAMIIFRTHGLGVGTALVTSDTYSQYHRVIDQLQNRIGAANVSGTLYFSLYASFVSQLICGRFPGTLILAMACNQMTTSAYSSAFIERGARAFVGWNNLVTVSRTDIVFASLAQMLLEGHPLGWSIQNVAERLGPDPFTGAQLSYAPAGESSIKL